METTHEYEVNIHWDAERKGTMSSPVLNDSIQVATPPQFPKGMEGFWSPEHLLTAAVSCCFMTTFLAIADNSRLEFSDFNVGGRGFLETVDSKLMMTRVELHPTITLLNEKDRERAERILMKAETACLISNSVKSLVTMTPTVIVRDQLVVA